MQIDPHLPDPALLRFEKVYISPELMTLVVSTTPRVGRCPVCGRTSSRVHSRYFRTLGDLPWHGTPVRIRVHARRFFCQTPGCPRRIFVERLPNVGAFHARKTFRLKESLREIGLALGAEAGSRLAVRLGMPASPDTLLRLVRWNTSLQFPTPRALGVDDWAWRRGLRYGTILCDLERRHPVDLLPERSAETLALWLRDHPL